MPPPVTAPRSGSSTPIDAGPAIDATDGPAERRPPDVEVAQETKAKAVQKPPPPRPGTPEAIVVAAQRRANDPKLGATFLKSSAFKSSNPSITGNYKDRDKCNMFAGDVLYEAGFRPPTHKLEGGGTHYRGAESWPKLSKHFDVITDKDAIRPGDVFAMNHLDVAGDGGGHLEIVTSVARDKAGRVTGFESIGAHEDRAPLVTREMHDLFLQNATKKGNHWEVPGEHIFLLRPKPSQATPPPGAIRG